MPAKKNEYDAEYWEFWNRVLNVFGKHTPHVFAAFIGIAILCLGLALANSFNQPVIYGSPPPAGASQQPQETKSDTVLSPADSELSKQRFIAAYADSLPGSNAEWLNWAYTWGVNTCARLDAGDTLAEVRADIPDDKYKNNMRLVTKDAILVMCPQHYDELSLPADYTKMP